MTNTYQSARLGPQSRQPRQGAGSREVKGRRNRGERPEGGVLGYSTGQEALPTQGSLMRPAGTSQRSAALLACSLHCLLSAEGVCLCSITGGPSSQASCHLDAGTWANPVRSQYQARRYGTT